MNILIVDDLIAPQIESEVITSLQKFSFITNRPKTFPCDNPEEADMIYAENDIDIAFIDIDLDTTRNGFQLKICKDKEETTIQKNYVLFVSSNIEGNPDREILLKSKSLTIRDFLEPDRRNPYFIKAFNALEEIGKFVQLEDKPNKWGYIKVDEILLITKVKGHILLYFSRDKPPVSIYDTNITTLSSTFKKAHPNHLIKINPVTIINTMYLGNGQRIPEILIKHKINLKTTLPNKNFR